jgi:RNA-directed DNA polymerase
MKRIGNLFKEICSIENLCLADMRARKNKGRQPCIQRHDLNREANIAALHELLMNKTYRTSKYYVFKIYDPKERDIFRLPYYPDRIVHHAIMNVLEPILVAMFTADTYSCIRGRGIHSAGEKLKKALQDKQRTVYCLKMDIRKFYPSVDGEVLKRLLRRKIKDADLLWLLDEIIDSAPGLPIGNYLSQYLANFFLTGYDHWLKEVKGVRYYFRYADDMIILSDNKPELHALLADIKQYMGEQLNLKLKGNYQIFPVEKRGIDFLGYVYFHTHTLARKRIKQRFARKLKKNISPEAMASHLGWLKKHCNSKNLIKKLTRENIQGIRNHNRTERLCRRKDRYRQGAEQGDRNT